jgi:putative copper export protein
VPVPRWLLPAVVAGGTCAAVLWWGGSISAARGGGLALDPGLTPLLLPLFTVAMQIAAAVTVGSLLAPVILVAGQHRSGRLMIAVDARPWLRVASWAATAWAAATAAVVLLTWADLMGVPVSSVDPAGALSVAASTTAGRGTLLVLALTVIVAYRCRWTESVSDTAVSLLLAVAAVLPAAFSGHAASSTNHQLAVSLMLLHAVGAVLWTGGLVALLLGRRHAALSVLRYSRLAGWCFALVGVSGLVSAVLRIGSWADLASAYGLLLGLKLAALCVLGGFGWWHRRATIPALVSGDGRAFARVAWVEVLAMAATLGLAGGLARTPPPREYGLADLVDLPVRQVLEWSPDPLFLTVAVAAVALYVRGTRRLGTWPVARTTAWMAGWLVVVAAMTPELTNPRIWTYDTVDNAQHLAVAVVAPVLLVLAKPLELARLTVRPVAEPGMRGPREWLDTLRESGPARWATRPRAAVALYAVALCGAYLSTTFDVSLYTHAGHLASTAAILGLSCVSIGVLTRQPRTRQAGSLNESEALAGVRTG